MRARRESARLSMGQESSIPSDRPPEAFLQVELGLPSEHSSGLVGAQVLMNDLIRSLVAHVGLEGALHLAEDESDQVEDRDLELVREVERLAGQLGPTRKGLGQLHVGVGAIL